VKPIEFDLAIIGASLAGSTVALKLAGSKAKIAIFDKAKFPRRKACGEGLSLKGGELIKSLGVGINLYPLNGYTIWKRGRPQELGRAQGEVGFGVERIKLDEKLFESALNCNSDLEPFLETKVRELEILRDSVKVIFESGFITARKVILADGAKSLAARRLGIPEYGGRKIVHGASLSCTIRQNLDSVQIVVSDGYEAYLTPVGQSNINLSFLGNQVAITQILDSENLKHELERLRETLSIDLEVNHETIGVGAVAPVRRHSVFGPIILVGDSSESLDPVSGMGMSHALLTGELAGDLLREYFDRTISWDSVQAHYLQSQKTLSRRLRGYTRAVNLLVRQFHNETLLKFSESIHLPHHFNNAAFSNRSNPSSFLLSLLGTTL